MRNAFRVILIAGAIGLSFGLYRYFWYGHHALDIVGSVMSCLIIGSLMMAVIYGRHYFLPAGIAAGGKALVVTLLLILASGVGTALYFLLLSWLPGGPPFRLPGQSSTYILNVLIVVVAGIPIYASEEGRRQLSGLVQSQQYRVLQLEQQQQAIELELLRAKVNPHFLYNVHNTIAGLIPTAPEKAETLVLLLSKFFRASLSMNSHTFHSLEAELDIVTTYLQMQQLRFGDRMQFSLHVPAGTEQWMVPSFILQPIVENAVKHGIEACTGGGTITITVQEKGGQLTYTITDPGTPFTGTPGSGAGLKLVTGKLQLLYGNAFRVIFNNPPEKYVSITFPSQHPDLAGRR